MSDPRFEGQVVVVTGAGRGIGYACAERFAAEGANLVIGDLDQAQVDAAVDELIADFGVKVVGVAGDLSQQSVAEATIKAAIDHYGRLDVLINNAGGGILRPFLDHTPETLKATIDRNLWTCIWCCWYALPTMRAQGYGRIVNLGADSVRNGLFDHAAYNAAKGAVVTDTPTLGDASTVTAVGSRIQIAPAAAFAGAGAGGGAAGVVEVDDAGELGHVEGEVEVGRAADRDQRDVAVKIVPPPGGGVSAKPGRRGGCRGTDPLSQPYGLTAPPGGGSNYRPQFLALWGRWHAKHDGGGSRCC